MRRIYSVLLLASAFLVSCGTDDGFTNTAPIPSGRLTVINAIPNSPTLTVETNNLRSGNISFGEATPANTVLPQIPLDFRVSFTNQNSVQTVVETEVTLDIDFRQTIILTGSIDNATITSIVDSPFTYEATSTDARIRFLNATTSVASASLALTNPNGTDATVAMTNGQPTGFTTTTSGDGNQIEVRDSSSDAVLWRSGEFFISPRADRLLVLVDYFGPGDENVRLISINDPSGTALFPNEEIISAVRFSNQAATFGPLDFLVDGTIAATLDFGGISDYVEFPQGTKTFSVTPAGDPTTELNSIDRTMFRGAFHNFQTATNVDATLVGSGFSVEDRRPIDTQSVVNITKLAPAVESIDLYFQNSAEALTGNPDIAGLTNFGSGALILRPNNYDLYITEQGNQTVLVGPIALGLESKGIYTIQITDSDGGGTPLQVVLLDDFQN